MGRDRKGSPLGGNVRKRQKAVSRVTTANQVHLQANLQTDARCLVLIECRLKSIVYSVRGKRKHTRTHTPFYQRVGVWGGGEGCVDGSSVNKAHKIFWMQLPVFFSLALDNQPNISDGKMN